MFTSKIKSMALLMACLAYAGQALATGPSGCYALDTGKFTASVKIPTIMTMNLSVPAMGILGITNSFAGDGGFVMSIPMLGSLSEELPSDFKGTWQSDKPHFFSATLTELNDLVGQLQSFGINANVKQSISGKVTDQTGDKISGKFTISLSANLQGKNASAKLSGTFKGTRTSYLPCASDNFADFAPAATLSVDEAAQPAGLADYINRLVNPKPAE